MTDGIIQKVINKEIEDLFLAGIQARQIEQIKRFTDKLQQELIEKIKGIENTVPNKWQLMIKLIGDNQE